MKKSFKKLGFVSLATSSVLLGSMNATDLQTYTALQKPSHVFGNYAEKKPLVAHTPHKVVAHQPHQPHQLKKMTQVAVAPHTPHKVVAHQPHQPHQLKPNQVQPVIAWQAS